MTSDAIRSFQKTWRLLVFMISNHAFRYCLQTIENIVHIICQQVHAFSNKCKPWIVLRRYAEFEYMGHGIISPPWMGGFFLDSGLESFFRLEFLIKTRPPSDRTQSSRQVLQYFLLSKVQWRRQDTRIDRIEGDASKNSIFIGIHKLTWAP